MVRLGRAGVLCLGLAMVGVRAGVYDFGSVDILARDRASQRRARPAPHRYSVRSVQRVVLFPRFGAVMRPFRGQHADRSGSGRRAIPCGRTSAGHHGLLSDFSND